MNARTQTGRAGFLTVGVPRREDFRVAPRVSSILVLSREGVLCVGDLVSTNPPPPPFFVFWVCVVYD